MHFYLMYLLIASLPCVLADHFFDFYLQKSAGQGQKIQGGFNYEYTNNDNSLYCSGCTNGDFKVGGKFTIKDNEKDK